MSFSPMKNPRAEKIAAMMIFEPFLNAEEMNRPLKNSSVAATGIKIRINELVMGKRERIRKNKF